MKPALLFLCFFLFSLNIWAQQSYMSASSGIKFFPDVQPGKMNLDAAFSVLLADHRIETLKMVFAKIAEKITVMAKFAYQPYEKNAHLKRRFSQWASKR